MQKIVTIVGARPQFIKASALSRAFHALEMPELLVHTGQHYDDNMADIFFRQMGIPEPAYNLGIHSLSHGAMTGRMIEALEKVLVKEMPSVVVVFGDTNSTLAGAIAAVKLHIPVAHVEAGLRSFNLKMPEEINRILTDRISSFLFCPSENAVINLKNEGFDHFPAKVEFTGDVMYDVSLYYSRISAEKSSVLKDNRLMGNKFILVTLHRPENTDVSGRLSEICNALNQLSEKYRIVFPIHPRTRKVLESSNIKLKFTPIDPVGYLDMVEFLKNCSFVVTDSGGLQKEAFFFRKHCLVTRDETEWNELVDPGYNFLVGADRQKILDMSNEISRMNVPFTAKPFGNGDAAFKIARILHEI